MPSRADVTPRPAYTIVEAVMMTGLDGTSPYAAVAHGDLLARKAGRRTLFLAEDLRSFMRRLPALGGRAEAA